MMGIGKPNDQRNIVRNVDSMKNMSKPSPRTEIRNLPYRYFRDLANMLDMRGDKDWKALISVLPEGMYTRAEVGRLEQVERTHNGSPSYELLTNLGHQLITVKQLIGYLTLINHQEALLLLKENEPVQITQQPRSICVQEGCRAVLKCAAKGFPVPSFQWIKDSHDELVTGIDKQLTFREIKLEDAGEYICKVTNAMGSEYTNTVSVQVTPNLAANVLPSFEQRRDMENDIHVTDQLHPVTVYPGQYFELSCGIDERPDLSFYWLKNGHEMDGENSSRLVFNPFQARDEGYYSCRVVGDEGDLLTKVVALKLGNLNIDFSDRQIATGKIALILGNQDYEHKRSRSSFNLVHSAHDARTLASILSEMNFKVICLINLTQKEMEDAVDGFCELLRIAPGMYGFFYFGGHGYEEGGKTFLVPVDAPENWTPENTVCADAILSEMQKSKTKLDVLVLDVCRTPSESENNCGKKSFDPQFIAGAQSVVCYATCPQSQAYEIRKDSNGMYMKHFIKHIKNDKKIEDVVHQVNMDVSAEAKLHPDTRAMSPTYRSSTTKIFSLCDPVVPDIDRDPTIRWFEHHRLPAAQQHEIENGIKVDLKFEPICSNVCYLLLDVVSIGDSTECYVNLFEISKELLVEDTDKNIPYNFPSQYVARSNPYRSKAHGTSQQLYRTATKISNLQKLKGNMVLTIEAVYRTASTAEKKTHKTIIIARDEFGITGLFS